MSDDMDYTDGVDDAPVSVTESDTSEEVTIEAVTTVLGDDQVGLFDLDGDGAFDLAVTQLPSGEVLQLLDSDGDGRIDAVDVDINADGISEVRVFHTADGYEFLYDGNGDGIFEDTTPVTREYLESGWPGVAQFLDAQFVESTPVVEPLPEPVTTSTQSAVTDAGDNWFQQSQNGFCVPASVAMLVGEYTGEPVSSEMDFVALANEQGLWSVGADAVPGMTADQGLQLLEAAGVPATLAYGDSLQTLDDLRESGHVIMVGVDSGEYWEGEGVEDDTWDHMVVVEDVDFDRGVVVINDPGHPDGRLMEVPIDVFADAWLDSENAMIVSDEPAPSDVVTDSPDLDVRTADEQGLEVKPGEGDQMATVVDYATQHPWALLPVMLPGDSVQPLQDAWQG